jgi:glycosyltransferase involved in cell wall biosynthesis
VKASERAVGNTAQNEMPQGLSPATRVLMTVDAVGGVWRYAMDLAASLVSKNTHFVFLGLGPRPSPEQRLEAEALGKLIWAEEAQLDWLADAPAEMGDLPSLLHRVAKAERVDLLHLNAPSQACRLTIDRPVVVVSHSCVVTWMHAVRGVAQPTGWAWQTAFNRNGFDAADAVVAPSRSHAAALEHCYGTIGNLSVVFNAAQVGAGTAEREPFIFAAGRWWDEGKNGSVLDAAAETLSWPVRIAGALRGPNAERIAMRHVDHLGELPSTEVRSLMKQAAIFVSPSLYEPFGLAPLEAASAGTPLVLADIPTYRELWDGAAMFASPRDPGSFSAALEALIASPALRHEMGRKALVRSQRYSAPVQAQAMLRLYQDVRAPAKPRLVYTS